jgi:aminomethyltransferase
MNENSFKEYKFIRESGAGFFKQKRGLIEVSGTEAIMFLNGLVTNDIKTLQDNSWMLAAFPNAQGRLLAIVRVLKTSDKFIFETEPETYEKVLQNLSRFTLAGDFKVNDLTEHYSYVSLRGKDFSNLKFNIPKENEITEIDFRSVKMFAIKAFRANGFDVFVPHTQIQKDFLEEIINLGAVEIDAVTQEVLRIENGIPKYGVDMDETTIVPELGIEQLISYNKGCYIGQEIIARIYFRGHVAKKLTGLVFEENASLAGIEEVKSLEGKNAGRLTSSVFSPKLEKQVALAYVRYDYLTEGTELKVSEIAAKVKDLPFFD